MNRRYRDSSEYLDLNKSEEMRNNNSKAAQLHLGFQKSKNEIPAGESIETPR